MYIYRLCLLCLTWLLGLVGCSSDYVYLVRAETLAAIQRESTLIPDQVPALRSEDGRQVRILKETINLASVQPENNGYRAVGSSMRSRYRVGCGLLLGAGLLAAAIGFTTTTTLSALYDRGRYSSTVGYAVTGGVAGGLIAAGIANCAVGSVKRVQEVAP